MSAGEEDLQHGVHAFQEPVIEALRGNDRVKRIIPPLH